VAASLAVSLDLAQRDVRAIAAELGGLSDPFRLDLPPDAVEDASLEPRPAAVLGSLYLLSELEQVDVVASAELLARERYGLGIRNATAAARLEEYAGRLADRPGPAARRQLYARLFGATWPDEPAAAGVVGGVPANAQFEELLAGYCDAIADFDQALARRAAQVLRTTGDRLRANLAPRQFGNTLVVAGRLVEQARDSLDLLGLAAIGQLLGVKGVWGVVDALRGDSGARDIGRHVGRGQAGRVVVGSCGYPPVADLVDAPLRQAAATWLVATGFDIGTPGVEPA
jgi:hypothetical protein